MNSRSMKAETKAENQTDIKNQSSNNLYSRSKTNSYSFIRKRQSKISPVKIYTKNSIKQQQYSDIMRATARQQIRDYDNKQKRVMLKLIDHPNNISNFNKKNCTPQQQIATYNNNISSNTNNKLKKLSNNFKLPLVSHGCNNNSNSSIVIEHPKYLFKQQIGQGAFSKVYSCIRKIDNQICVIKLYDSILANSSQSRRQNLKNELCALQLAKHPNIIGYLQHFETQNHIGIVMQHFSHKSLSQYKKQKKKGIKQNTLKSITKQICQGLIHLHQNGISHRDIKPENILVDSQCQQTLQIKLIDFGFATNGSEDELVVAGTPYFMPPQLIAKKGYDPIKADVWALGIMVYWLATGYYPQQASYPSTTKNIPQINPNKSKKIIRPLLNFPIDMDPGLEYLLQKILNPEPKQRITLDEILDDTWVKPRSLQAQIDRLRKSTQAVTMQQIQFV